MKLAFKKPISSRLFAIATVTFVMVFLVIAINIYLNKKNLALTHILNQINAQIRLSQVMIKEVFLSSYAYKHSPNRIQSDVQSFDQKFNVLYYQNNLYDFFWLDKKEAQTTFDKLYFQWSVLASGINAYQIATHYLHKNRSFLSANNKKLLDLSDGIVKAMLKAQRSQQEIDTAGRQRMLSQRISYKMLVYAASQDRNAYEEFLEAFEAYNATIVAFYTHADYKKYPALYGAIKSNYNFWQEYATNIRQVIANQEVLFDSFVKINEYGTLVSKNLEILYGLYTEASKKIERTFNIFQYIAVVMISFVIFGLFFTIAWVKSQIKNFVNYFKDMRKNNISDIQIDANTELARARDEIDEFIERIQKTKGSALLAKQLGEQIHNEILEISADIKTHLQKKNFTPSEQEEIQKQIDMSEYIAIQSSDELISITRRLEKLKDSIDKSVDIYTNCLACSKITRPKS
ncbi:hypothetical protein BKH46_01195 [Helicobacter sp. 12S02634-8]|uniref:type IV pili methyl-accepting chemotaxis transducer N-terminal domain-containing protein n=1 Tax=Helicobacter sp. 12S02634-8 TaxID=1476199 RepID=UPI000BA73D8A|nr:type IV pili methyl-accepting chemotaxis transducer N-terminal domain-containing protein [Helicobacter sp. 12S02634-8]PAF48549.1 hypothetical protein BKH46_01195 [Helicobacter sp. 12S02634-8]